MPFGNVKVDYKPCKSAGQLKAAALYMLGKKPGATGTLLLPSRR